MKLQSACILSLLLFSGCSSDNSESQLDNACNIIHYWPTDRLSVQYYKPDNIAENVIANITLKQELVGIDDGEALDIITKYKEYWKLFELAFILGDGKIAPSAPANSALNDVMKHCDDIGRSFKELEQRGF